ncbi:hypothetical protein [Catellatospora citrea]|uniref:Uncharacterized protein n=1 Tax=Catellatospora citrea TaxID=53366 RepID=A0A8J3KF45_9ACTN|nr:hypothetical protein [Catellatospora citrea]RKE06562.1 hypothetical protein C8E86_1383 [Catellatospora citrea]GIF98557.1 hypothetical protein Cci01nite_36510 [Catellatospora citrea]
MTSDAPGDRLTPRPVGYLAMLTALPVCGIGLMWSLSSMVRHRGIGVVPLLLTAAVAAAAVYCARMLKRGVHATYAYVYIVDGRVQPVHFNQVQAFSVRPDSGAPTLWIDLTDGSTLPTPVTEDPKAALGKVRVTPTEMTTLTTELNRRRLLPYHS